MTVHNKKQNVIKKRWLIEYGKDLENLYHDRLSSEIGDFKYDNLKTDDGNDILGLFQESYNPIDLHIDGGFNLNDIIYKQTLIPLTPVGSTVIFKTDTMASPQISQQIKELEIKFKIWPKYKIFRAYWYVR